MRVLVVEDNEGKQTEILALLRKYGLDNYCFDNNTRDGYYSATDTEYDLLICDMDLPRNGSFPIIEDELEGLNLIRDMISHDIKIPTIIFSPVEISEAKLEHIKETGYPLIGHAKDAAKLDEFMDEKFFGAEETVEEYLALAKVVPRFRRNSQDN